MQKFHFTLALGGWLISGLASGMDAQVLAQVQSDLDKKNAHQSVLANAQLGGGGFVTVGAGAGCDFDANVLATPIQDAIDSGAPEVRVVSAVYMENLLIDDVSLSLRSGFTDCTEAANNNQLPLSFASIDGGLNVLPVIRIIGESERHTVNIEHFALANGTADNSVIYGGGLSVRAADVELHLDLLLIFSNTAILGGGIGVANGSMDLTGRHVLVFDNTANNGGGGVFCRSPSNSVMLYGMSAFINNDVTVGSSVSGYGGGGYFTSGCDLSMYPQPYPELTVQLPGIHGNRSSSRGGGLYVSPLAEAFLFGQKMCVDGDCLGDNLLPFIIANNESGAIGALSDKAGGGLYIGATETIGSPVYANALYLVDNLSGTHGGGVFVAAKASLVIERTPGACWNPMFCNYIGGNQSSSNIGFGGAIYNLGTVDIANALITENRADFGTVLYATGSEASTRMESVLVVDNGDGGSGAYSDFHVFQTGTDASTEIVHATIADNSSGPSTFNIEPLGNNALTLLSSIVWDPLSGTTMSPVHGTLNIDCVMTHEFASIAGATRTTQNIPLFISPGIDYRLDLATSPAVDYCDDAQVNIEHTDLDQHPRGYDEASRANLHGPYDLGAYEDISSDVIFANDFDN